MKSPTWIKENHHRCYHDITIIIVILVGWSLEVDFQSVNHPMIISDPTNHIIDCWREEDYHSAMTITMTHTKINTGENFEEENVHV